MPRTTTKLTEAQPQTTAQSLGSLLKSARDIMRKDKGLNGDLDRLPLLTWIMFLKFLDDLELQRAQEAKLAGKKFRPAIEPPYRWRDWAARPDGVTGEELLAFINNEQCTRPDGTNGAGLFAYLRKLTSSNGDDRRDVIATVFQGVDNRMKSGYLLRDVINKVGGIHFTSSDELHTLGALYESMLREMRDSAGDSGEFYTPRPVVRFMVEVVNPRLGETVLDPACGTGGFLVEAFAHLNKQVRTVADRRLLQTATLSGCEPKPLPYLLGQMNLLLHGLDAPQIDPGNALRFKLAEIGEKDRVDVILTNPPFGGEEEKGVQGNFPQDRQTSETALLFLQLIMRRLRRAQRPGRAAVVVPDGVLAADGVAGRIKLQLVSEFNLHTIVRLPSGVFAPYTGIPTNILFFDSSRATTEIWYYEHPLPQGRKTYTKTAPLDYEEFGPCQRWWNAREGNEHAWNVNVSEILATECNLDVKNPALQSEAVGVDLSKKAEVSARQVSDVAAELVPFLGSDVWHTIERVNKGSWSTVVLGDLLNRVTNDEVLVPETAYRLIGIRLAGGGPFLRETRLGAEIGARRLNRIQAGTFIYSRLFAWRGAFGLVPRDLDGCHASGEFPAYRVEQDVVLAEFLLLYFTRPVVWQAVEKKCRGTTKASRNRFKEEYLLGMRISIPDLASQKFIVDTTASIRQHARRLAGLEGDLSGLPLAVLAAAYRGNL